MVIDTLLSFWRISHRVCSVANQGEAKLNAILFTRAMRSEFTRPLTAADRVPGKLKHNLWYSWAIGIIRGSTQEAGDDCLPWHDHTPKGGSRWPQRQGEA